MPYTNHSMVISDISNNVMTVDSTPVYKTEPYQQYIACNPLLLETFEFLDRFEREAHSLLRIPDQQTINYDPYTTANMNHRTQELTNYDYYVYEGRNSTEERYQHSKDTSLRTDQTKAPVDEVWGQRLFDDPKVDDYYDGRGFRNKRSFSSIYDPYSTETLKNETEDQATGRTFPDVVCKTSNTGMYSFLAFAILSLDITADIMATVNIDINITGNAGTATTNNTNTNNNTNNNNNNNTNTNTNTNNNGRRRSLGTLNPDVGSVLEWIVDRASPVQEDPVQVLVEEGPILDIREVRYEESEELKDEYPDDLDEYFTGEAELPVAGYEDESPFKLPDNFHQELTSIHQKLLKRQGRALRSSYSESYLKAWFETLLNIFPYFLS